MLTADDSADHAKVTALLLRALPSLRAVSASVIPLNCNAAGLPARHAATRKFLAITNLRCYALMGRSHHRRVRK
jgi:hypothetical protein